MRNYRNRYSSRNNAKGGKIGFYSALSVCIIAVGLAVWSTYASVSEYMKTNEAYSAKSQLTTVADTAIDMTIATQPATMPQTQPQTKLQEIIISETHPNPEYYEEYTESDLPDETQSVLQMILAVSGTMQYPLNNKTIIQEYSEETIFNRTLNDYRAHTGTDFKGEKGADVLSMSEGTVNSIFTDDYYGVVVSVKGENFEIQYCGIGETSVSKGDTVEIGDIIGTVGEVPFEAADESHIHVEIKVNGQYCDPLTLIAGTE